MSRRLDDLQIGFRLVVFEFLARLTEAGIHVAVVDTLRTPEEHAINLSSGVSWIKRSKHLDGLAIDVCPFHTWALHGTDKLMWDATDPVWKRIGEAGEKLGLVWGGRWTHKDMGHFEMSAEALRKLNEMRV